MRWILLLICSIAVCAFIGCSSEQQVVEELPSANPIGEAASVSEAAALGKQQKDVYVFRAKYYQTTGPCIQIGDALGMPIIDAFDVVDVLNGDFNIETIHVRAMTDGGPSYPKDMEEGKLYTLQLTPSKRTTKQLQEIRKEGHTFLWIDGDEIATEGTNVTSKQSS